MKKTIFCVIALGMSVATVYGQDEVTAINTGAGIEIGHLFKPKCKPKSAIPAPLSPYAFMHPKTGAAS